MFTVTLQNIFQGFSQLWSHKMRSLLTLLGIFIGIAAIIGSNSLLDAVNRMVIRNFERWGSLKTVGISTNWGEYKDGRWTSFEQTYPISLDDAEAIRENIDHLETIDLSTRDNATVTFNAIAFDNITLTGSTLATPEMDNLKVEYGRFISDYDVEDWAKTAVLTSKLRDDMFGESENPVGKEIQISNRGQQTQRFIVVGVIEKRGGANSHERARVYIPYTTAIYRTAGMPWGGIEIKVKADDVGKVEEVKKAITRLMVVRHPGAEPKHFEVWNLGEWQDEALGEVKTQGYILYGVAILCLLTGGIGIMNIMLVSVTERTREIGIRKALGAKHRHIFIQFLIESLVLAFVGGLLGVLGGWGVGEGFSKIMQNTMDDSENLEIVLSAGSMMLAVGMALGVSLIFGIYPAMKAAKLNPIDALRYE